MNTEQTNLNPETETETSSLWDDIDTDRSPTIKFDINIPHVVQFPSDFIKPEEYENDNGRFCSFDVLENGAKVRINSSAYTLLAGLKRLSPLAGKSVRITKKLHDGRQTFYVEPVEA